MYITKEYPYYQISRYNIQYMLTNNDYTLTTISTHQTWTQQHLKHRLSDFER